MISRRRFLQATAATIATGSGFSYMHYREPGWFELIRHRLAFFKDNAAPFKILFLADLHYSRFVPLSLISDAIALGIEQKPDLILLGGDYVLFDMPLNFSAFSDVLSPPCRMCADVCLLRQPRSPCWYRKKSLNWRDVEISGHHGVV